MKIEIAKKLVIEWISMGIPISKALDRLHIDRDELMTVCTDDELSTAAASFVSTLVDTAYSGALESPTLAMTYLSKADPDIFVPDDISTFSSRMDEVMKKLDQKAIDEKTR